MVSTKVVDGLTKCSKECNLRMKIQRAKDNIFPRNIKKLNKNI